MATSSNRSAKTRSTSWNNGFFIPSYILEYVCLIKQICTMDLKGLPEVGKIANKRVTDSEIRRKRISDAKRRMAMKRGESATSLNRIGDSAKPSRSPMRGGMAKRVVASQMARKQDSRAKTYFALRKRIKDELEETETTEEAIDAAVSVLEENVAENPADVVAAVVEVLSDVMDTLPSEGEAGADEEPADDEDFGGEEEEVSDSLRNRRVVRRGGIADSRKRSVVRRRSVADARKRPIARKRGVVADSRKRAALRREVLDSLARKRAAQKRIRDARVRRADATRMGKRVVRRG